MISERYIIPYIMNILSLKKYITLISYHNGVILFGVISQHTYIYIYVLCLYISDIPQTIPKKVTWILRSTVYTIYYDTYVYIYII
jgi:hypothetical protein